MRHINLLIVLSICIISSIEAKACVNGVFKWSETQIEIFKDDKCETDSTGKIEGDALKKQFTKHHVYFDKCFKSFGKYFKVTCTDAAINVQSFNAKDTTCAKTAKS